MNFAISLCLNGFYKYDNSFEPLPGGRHRGTSASANPCLHCDFHEAPCLGYLSRTCVLGSRRDPDPPAENGAEPRLWSASASSWRRGRGKPMAPSCIRGRQIHVPPFWSTEISGCSSRHPTPHRRPPSVCPPKRIKRRSMNADKTMGARSSLRGGIPLRTSFEFWFSGGFDQSASPRGLIRTTIQKRCGEPIDRSRIARTTL